MTATRPVNAKEADRWQFTEEAKALCSDTITKGVSDKPLANRIVDAVGLFDGLGVTLPRLEARLGRVKTDWSAHDLATLTVAYKSIQQGTVSVDEEFPQERVTAGEIVTPKVAQ